MGCIILFFLFLMIFDRMNLSTSTEITVDQDDQGNIIGMLSRNPSQIDPYSITMFTCWEILHQSIRNRKFKISEFLNKHY